jgi:diguanylate cyclase (GGDEF)-like protein/PAS domain S-box-containing protein
LKNAQPCAQLIKESEEKFRKLAESSLFGMFIYKEYFVYVNKTFCEMSGYSEEELLQMHPWELVEKEKQDKFEQIVKKRLSGAHFKANYTDAHLLQKSGQLQDVKVSVETINYNQSYAGLGVVMDISDVVKQKQMIQVLIQALSQSDDIVFITNSQGIIEYVNQALLDIYGYKKEEIIGKTPSIFASKEHDNSFYKNLWNTILAGKNYHEMIVNKKRDGSIIYVDTKITPVKDHINSKITYFAVTARDITKRVLIEKRLERLATIDVLTQVANRYQLHQYIDDFIERAKRNKQSFSLLIFDIDDFKAINDTYGHYVGDLVLKDLSQLIVGSIRSVDKFGRWGGEEFVLLLDNTKIQAAKQVAHKLRRVIKEYQFHEHYSITVSIGATEYLEGDNEETIVTRADKALYRAKESGKDRVVLL